MIPHCAIVVAEAAGACHVGRMRAPTYVLLVSTSLLACGGSSSSDVPPGSAALDGTWDVVAFGGVPGGASSVTVNGGTFDGTFELPDASPGCTSTMSLVIQGNAMSGALTPAAACKGRVATLTGTRTQAKPDEGTPWNGTWTITASGDEKGQGEVVISGLSATAKAWQLSVAGGVATATSTRDRFTFVARRR